MHVPPSTFAPAAQTGQQFGQSGAQQSQNYNYPPQNHIAQPPHSTGPTLTGPRIRIDPSQLPDPIEAQELDQNLYDDEDFMSCDTKGLIPLAGTDYRGVDQGECHTSDKVWQCLVLRVIVIGYIFSDKC
jgi:protein transport protein SEC24